MSSKGGTLDGEKGKVGRESHSTWLVQGMQRATARREAYMRDLQEMFIGGVRTNEWNLIDDIFFHC